MSCTFNTWERGCVFRYALLGFAEDHAEEIARGMSDEELSDVLHCWLNLHCARCDPDGLSVISVPEGLRIHAAWTPEGIDFDRPIFAGAETLAMAREVYGIANPEEDQLSLL